MSIQLHNDRIHRRTRLSLFVEPLALLGCSALIVVIGAWAVRSVENNFNDLVAIDRDNGRSEFDELPWQPVHGQQLYVPAYSHISHQKSEPYLLTVTLNIRNMDVNNEISVVSVRYFDTRGQELRSLLQRPLRLSPLAVTDFVIAREAESGGRGASFLVEWVAGTEVAPPVVESVNINSSTPRGLAFIAPGIVIEETKPLDSVRDTKK